MSIAAVIAAPLPARAQASDVEVAKQHFQTGQLHYERGEYDMALKAFQEAYRLARRPALQYNIALTHEKLLHRRDAIAAYRAYLAGTPDAEDRASVEVRIQALEEQLSEKKAAQKKTLPEPEPEPPPRPPPPTLADLAQPRENPPAKPHKAPTKAPEAVETKATTPATPSPPGRWMRVGGVVALSAGGALALLGTVFSVMAHKEASALEDANQNGKSWADSQDIQDDGERNQTIGIVGLVLGGVGIATGATLLVLARRAQPARVVAGPMGLEVRF